MAVKITNLVLRPMSSVVVVRVPIRVARLAWPWSCHLPQNPTLRRLAVPRLSFLSLSHAHTYPSNPWQVGSFRGVYFSTLILWKKVCNNNDSKIWIKFLWIQKLTMFLSACKWMDECMVVVRWNLFKWQKRPEQKRRRIGMLSLTPWSHVATTCSLYQLANEISSFSSSTLEPVSSNHT